LASFEDEHINHITEIKVSSIQLSIGVVIHRGVLKIATLRSSPALTSYLKQGLDFIVDIGSPTNNAIF